MAYLTPTDLINLKVLTDAMEINTKQIGKLIQDDLSSPLKQHMSEGMNYYESRHDILNNVRYYWRDGVQVTNAGRSNNKIPHPFHKILVDQKVAYIAGNPIVLGVDESKSNEQFKEFLTDLLTERFDDILNDWIIGACNKAVEWLHFYINTRGEFKYVIVPSGQVIAVYDTQYEDELVYIIRYYIYDLIDAQGKTKQRYKVEWWTKEKVEYWVQTQEGQFVHDPDYEVNPAPHWFSFNTLNPSLRKDNSWQRVPFVPLYNNSEQHTDLQPVKALIDAYDKVVSGWANDLEDFLEQIIVVKGWMQAKGEVSNGLTELAAFIRQIKEDGAVAVESEGDVTRLPNEIPVEAKDKFLQITRRAIFYFGEGVDVDSERFGGEPSGVALKFLYASLDLKANRLIRKLKTALKDVAWFTTTYINMKEAKSFDPNQVTFTIKKAVIFNEKEKIEEVNMSKDMLSEETCLANHPLVEDVKAEMERLEKQRKNEPLRVGELGKLPLAIQQLALARTRAEESGDVVLSEQIGEKINQLLEVLNAA